MPLPLSGLLRASLLAALAVVSVSFAAPPLRAQEAPAVVYLVRHAEKADDSRDPALSAEGVERAHLLARVLADAGITRIISSDFQRTRDTAAPLADRLGLTVEIYDPRALDQVAQDLRDAGGRVLVSGHSNTTPQLVELLGGQPGTPIRDADEYDRLYVLTLGTDGTSTVLLRYGAGTAHP